MDKRGNRIDCSATSDNTAYTLRLRLALRDIAPFGRNVVYAGNVIRNRLRDAKHLKIKQLNLRNERRVSEYRYHDNINVPLNLAVGLGMIHPGSDMPNPMGLKEFSKGMICRFWVPA